MEKTGSGFLCQHEVLAGQIGLERRGYVARLTPQSKALKGAAAQSIDRIDRGRSLCRRRPQLPLSRTARSRGRIAAQAASGPRTIRLRRPSRWQCLRADPGIVATPGCGPRHQGKAASRWSLATGSVYRVSLPGRCHSTDARLCGFSYAAAYVRNTLRRLRNTAAPPKLPH
jgi:hypothetical protein